MPRTSEACYVCKSRKIKCVMQRGGCVGCQRSAIKCPGPSSKTQSYKPRFKSAVSGKHSSSAAPGLQHVATGVADQCTTKLATRPHVAALASSTNTDVQLVSFAAPNPAPQNRMAVYGRFLESYLPEVGTGHGGYTYFAYLEYLPGRIDRNPALCAAMEAVSVSQLGAELHDDGLIHDASDLYRQALRQMTRLLIRPVFNADMLAASILLGLCEFSSTTSADSGRGWTSHVSGQVRMLEMLGPKAVEESPFLFQLFINVRNAALSLGSITRRATPFEKPAWRALTASPALVDAYLALSDINTSVPALLETIDHFAAGTRTVDTDAAASSLRAIEMRLLRFAAQFPPASTARGPWLVAASHAAPTRALPPVPSFTHVHAFADFRAAIMHMSWHVSQLVIGGARRSLETAFGAAVPPTPLSIAADPVENARNVARTVAFVCQARFGSVGRIASLVCLRYASGVFLARGLTDEARWCGLLVGQIRAAGVCQPPVLVAD